MCEVAQVKGVVVGLVLLSRVVAHHLLELGIG